MLDGIFVQFRAAKYRLDMEDPALLVGAVVAADWAEHEDAEPAW